MTDTVVPFSGCGTVRFLVNLRRARSVKLKYAHHGGVGESLRNVRRVYYDAVGDLGRNTFRNLIKTNNIVGIHQSYEFDCYDGDFSLGWSCCFLCSEPAIPKLERLMTVLDTFLMNNADGVIQLERKGVSTGRTAWGSRKAAAKDLGYSNLESFNREAPVPRSLQLRRRTTMAIRDHPYKKGGPGGFGRSRGVCFDWQAGRCNRGARCRFSHSARGGPSTVIRTRRRTWDKSSMRGLLGVSDEPPLPVASERGTAPIGLFPERPQPTAPIALFPERPQRTEYSPSQDAAMPDILTGTAMETVEKKWEDDRGHTSEPTLHDVLKKLTEISKEMGSISSRVTTLEFGVELPVQPPKTIQRPRGHQVLPKKAGPTVLPKKAGPTLFVEKEASSSREEVPTKCGRTVGLTAQIGNMKLMDREPLVTTVPPHDQTPR